jgi:hypothetical protein
MSARKLDNQIARLCGNRNPLISVIKGNGPAWNFGLDQSFDYGLANRFFVPGDARHSQKAHEAR